MTLHTITHHTSTESISFCSSQTPHRIDARNPLHEQLQSSSIDTPLTQPQAHNHGRAALHALVDHNCPVIN